MDPEDDAIITDVEAGDEGQVIIHQTEGGRGSRKFWVKGYSYSDGRALRNNRTSWRCSRRRRGDCDASVITHQPEGATSHKVDSVGDDPHNHDPDANVAPVWAAIKVSQYLCDFIQNNSINFF